MKSPRLKDLKEFFRYFESQFEFPDLFHPFVIIWAVFIFLLLSLFYWSFEESWEKVGPYILIVGGLFVFVWFIVSLLIVFDFFTTPLKYRIISYPVQNSNYKEEHIYLIQGKSRLGIWLYINDKYSVKLTKSPSCYFDSFKRATDRLTHDWTDHIQSTKTKLENINFSHFSIEWEGKDASELKDLRKE